MNRAFTDLASGVTTISTPSKREIRAERVFDASREEVWRAFTIAELLAEWWGRGNKLIIEQLKVAPNGPWRFVEHATDGITSFFGEYREVAHPGRLVQTFSWQGNPGSPWLTTAEFEELDAGRTLVTTTVLFDTEQERDATLKSGMTDGMDESYSSLDRLLARQNRTP